MLALETSPSARTLASGLEELIYFPRLLFTPGDLCSCPSDCFCPGSWLEHTEVPTFAFLEDSPGSEENNRQTNETQPNVHTGAYVVRCLHWDAALSTVTSAPLKCVPDFCF